MVWEDIRMSIIPLLEDSDLLEGQQPTYGENEVLEGAGERGHIYETLHKD